MQDRRKLTTPNIAKYCGCLIDQINAKQVVKIKVLLPLISWASWGAEVWLHHSWPWNLIWMASFTLQPSYPDEIDLNQSGGCGEDRSTCWETKLVTVPTELLQNDCQLQINVAENTRTREWRRSVERPEVGSVCDQNSGTRTHSFWKWKMT